MRRWIGWSLAAMLFSTPALAAECGQDGNGFDAWLGHFKQQAARSGISRDTIDVAFADAAYDPEVIAHDHMMRGFGRNFERFAAKRVTPARIKRGRTMLLSYAEALNSIENRYGVPGEVLVAIWGLETGFGADTGNVPTFRVLATLAYDCRRQDEFQAELIAALRILQRGLLQPEDMKGAWAGEIGQTQFMPSNYLKYAVAFDGGAPDLIHNPADALASTANFLRAHGWQRGQSWDENGPNYAALLEWNEAPAYAKTIALFADRLSGG